MATLVLSSSLYAIRFETLGYRSISMGGASVANSTGSLAAYNNPALLAKTPYGLEVSLGVGVSEADYGVGAAAGKLDEIGFLDTIDKATNNYNSLTAEDKQVLVEGKNIVLEMDGDSLNVVPQAHLSAQLSNFGFGIFAGSDSAATASVDTNYDQLIFQQPDGNYTKINDDGSESASNETEYNNHSVNYAFENGLTYTDVKGIALAEVPIAYGHNFETNIGNIMVGGAVKYMHAVTYVDVYKVDNTGESSGEERKDKQSANFGIDIGLAYQPSFSYDLTFGLVAKNLNAPSFDFYDGSSYNIDPLVRAGVAYNIFESLQIAADIDLTSNEMLTRDVDSQMLGGGINYEPFTNFFALSLRGGLMKNLHKSDQASIIYTAGLGIGVKWFQLDVSGQYASKTNSIDGYSVPQYSKVNVALVSRW